MVQTVISRNIGDLERYRKLVSSPAGDRA